MSRKTTEKVVRLCDNCHNNFTLLPCEARRRKARFCSRKCQHEYRKNVSPKVLCEVCKKEFSASKCNIEKGKSRFCSLRCYHKSTENKITLICDECSKIFDVSESTFFYHKTRFCSKYCYGKWSSRERVGENAPVWKGGVTPENKRRRGLIEYHNWRVLVFQGDGYICQCCFDPKRKNLNAHHIFPWAKYPNLRYTLENGVTLCYDCHTTWHKQMRKDSFWSRI